MTLFILSGMAQPARVGFESRNCFCLWSSGQHTPSVIKAIEDNHKTYLHPLWEKAHFFVVVEGEEGKTQFSFSRILWSLLSYPCGMFAYLIDTIVKTTLLIGNFIYWLVSLTCGDPSWSQNRTILLLDTLASVGISIVGIIAPPLAYRLDTLSKDHFVAWANNPSNL